MATPAGLLMIDDALLLNGNGGNVGSNGGGFVSLINTSNITPSPLVGENRPTQKFDIGVLANLRPSDKYLGRNLVSDIREAYDTYITGSPIGRGGQYAVDAARRYGTTITEAARGYLVAVGLPTLADIIPTPTPTPVTQIDLEDGDFFGLPVPPDKVVQTVTQDTKTLIETLGDQLSKLFGGAVYNPPLQSQATGYSPATVSQPLSSGRSSVGLLLILGVVGVIGYFVYKRYKG